MAKKKAKPPRTPTAVDDPADRLRLDVARPLFAEWGRQGGKRRAERLTSAERSAIGRQGARVRWTKQPTKPTNTKPTRKRT